ncbi:MAG: response regulator, partial [bacterium]
MNILTVADLDILRIFLSKIFVNYELDYTFTAPNSERIKKNIEKENPDIIIIQSAYHDISPEKMTSVIKEKSEVPIVVICIDQNRRTFEKLHPDFSEKPDIHVFDRDFFTEGFIPFAEEITGIPLKKAYDLNSSEKTEKNGKKTILYADDSNTMHQFFMNSINREKYNIYEAYDGEEALKIYNKTLPDIIITDIEMPKMTGLELCREIKEHNDDRFIPVIILSSLDNPIDIDTAFRYGADDYLTKPMSGTQLRDKVEEYFKVIERKEHNKVLVVEFDKISRELIKHALIKNGIQVFTESNGNDAYYTAKNNPPDVLITDIDLPGINGHELIRKMKQTKGLEEISVIMIGNMQKEAIDRKNTDQLGVARYFTKPFDVEKLVLIVNQILLEKYNMFKKEYEYMLSTMKVLVNALEARDEYTKGHSERVSKYSVMLARYMNLPTTVVEKIEIASSLHDIGKIGVRDEILLKSGNLTDEEYAKIQEHAVVGAEILKPVESLSDIIPLILYHHERWDGKGYPSMLKGEEIPLGARIMAVADTFDAVTSNR